MLYIYLADKYKYKSAYIHIYIHTYMCIYIYYFLKKFWASHYYQTSLLHLTLYRTGLFDIFFKLFTVSLCSLGHVCTRFYKVAAEPDNRGRFQGLEVHWDLLREEHVMWRRCGPQNLQNTVMVIACCSPPNFPLLN